VTDRSAPPSRTQRSARRRAQIRRRRAVVAGAAALLVLIVIVASVVAGSGKASNTSATTSTTAAGAARTTGAGIPAVEAGIVPWTLPGALSREVVLPASGNSLLVVGGLLASQASTATILSLDVSSGTSSVVGHLAAATHDAGGATLHGTGYLFGGGTPTTVATVESFTGPTSTSPSVTASTTGQLPQPRSDDSAVTIGDTAYVVGGYDGTNPDPQVLATTDGSHYSVVANLPVPVRYGATVAYGGKIYVFGGEAITSSSGNTAGQPVDAVQQIDPSAKSAKVIAHLPQPVEGAVAAVIGNHVYVAGGVTNASSSSSSPGAGAGAGSSSSSSSSPSAGSSASSSGQATGAIYAFDTSRHALLNAGTLPVPVAYGAAQVVGNRAWIVGGERNGQPVASVEMFTPNTAFGTAGAPGAGSPFFGDKLLVADRGNNRLLVLDDTNKIIWQYPSPTMPAPPGGFYFPDDSFFAKKGSEIIINQEENETIVILGYPSGQVLWQYGHPKVIGTSVGYLHEPDDAYLLKNGQITVANAMACTIQILNPDKTVAQTIGTTNSCHHEPPNFLGSPNGDTPLADGNLLVSEINGSWLSEYTTQGKLVWTTHINMHYPSDAQQLGPDLYLVSDYAHPGQILEVNREGQILYRYQPTSGLGELNQPSLTELLPSGVFMTNDDYRDRMVAIDPTTQAIVWQYGVADTPGTSPGYLNTPDGFDLLAPDGSTPTHQATS